MFFIDKKVKEENKQLKKEIEDLKRASKISKFTNQQQRGIVVPVAGFDSRDGEPVDSQEREEYIGEVDRFFENILRDKLRITVGEVREELAGLSGRKHADIGLTREQYDFFLRGMEGMAWKMEEWCTTLQGERNAKLQDK